MKFDEPRELLDRCPALVHPCDLDLLVFFARHPHSLLASEHLAALLGYDIKRLAQSLDVLLDAGLVRRSPTSTHAARMYEFAAGSGGNGDGWMPALIRLAGTRRGRLGLVRLLKTRASGHPASRTTGPRVESPRSRPYLVPPATSGKRRRSGGDDV